MYCAKLPGLADGDGTWQRKRQRLGLDCRPLRPGQLAPQVNETSPADRRHTPRFPRPRGRRRAIRALSIVRPVAWGQAQRFLDRFPTAGSTHRRWAAAVRAQPAPAGSGTLSRHRRGSRRRQSAFAPASAYSRALGTPRSPPLFRSRPSRRTSQASPDRRREGSGERVRDAPATGPCPAAVPSRPQADAIHPSAEEPCPSAPRIAGCWATPHRMSGLAKRHPPAVEKRVQASSGVLRPCAAPRVLR